MTKGRGPKNFRRLRRRGGPYGVLALGPGPSIDGPAYTHRKKVVSLVPFRVSQQEMLEFLHSFLQGKLQRAPAVSKRNIYTSSFPRLL